MSPAIRLRRLYSVASGPSDAPPLLMISGFGVSSSTYEPLAELYAARFRTIRFDPVGAGQSSRLGAAPSTPQLAADAVRVLDEHGIASAHVLGMSLGGLTAQELALRFPHRVRSLILVSTAANGPLASLAPFARLSATVAGSLVDGARRRRLSLARVLFADGFRERDPEWARTVLRTLDVGMVLPWTFVPHLCAYSTHERERSLRRLAMPTLVLHGDEDLLVSPRNAHRLGRAIPHAEVRILPGGHGMLYERPLETLELVAGWVEAQPEAPPVPPPGRAAAAAELAGRYAAPWLGTLRVQRGAVSLLLRAGR